MCRYLALTMIVCLFNVEITRADTYRHGSHVIADGDGEARVRKVMGKPDRTSSVAAKQKKQGKARLLEYFIDGKTIIIEIAGGSVRSIRQSN